MLLTGVAYGSIADSINDFVKDNKALADIIAAQGGASLADSYLAMSFRILALVGAGFAIQSALRLRSEETSLHAEQILATPVSRERWAASHLVVAFGGTIGVLLVAGASVGVSDAIATGDLGIVRTGFGAALVYTPADLGARRPHRRAHRARTARRRGELGLPHRLLRDRNARPAPRASDVGAGCLAVPARLQLPAADLSIVPLLALTALAGGLTTAGLAGLRRRDIG